MRDLTPAEVEQLGASLGLTPKEVWDWVKDKLTPPGRIPPRPGKGLPSTQTVKLIAFAILAYIVYRDLH